MFLEVDIVTILYTTYNTTTTTRNIGVILYADIYGTSHLGDIFAVG